MSNENQTTELEPKYLNKAQTEVLVAELLIASLKDTISDLEDRYPELRKH